MKKYIIAYALMHITGHYCLLNAAAQASIVTRLDQYDELAFSIAQRVPQWGKYTSSLATLMGHGKENILTSSHDEHPTITFNHPDQGLNGDFDNLQDSIKTLPQELLAPTTQREKCQLLDEARGVIQRQHESGRLNVPWHSLVQTYQQKAERELSQNYEHIVG